MIIEATLIVIVLALILGQLVRIADVLERKP